MKCVLCGNETNIMYTMRKHGLICSDCMRKTKNSKKGKLKEKERILRMYKRYGVAV